MGCSSNGYSECWPTLLFPEHEYNWLHNKSNYALCYENSQIWWQNFRNCLFWHPRARWPNKSRAKVFFGKIMTLTSGDSSSSVSCNVCKVMWAPVTYINHIGHLRGRTGRMFSNCSVSIVGCANKLWVSTDGLSQRRNITLYDLNNRHAADIIYLSYVVYSHFIRGFMCLCVAAVLKQHQIEK